MSVWVAADIPLGSHETAGSNVMPSLGVVFLRGLARSLAQRVDKLPWTVACSFLDHKVLIQRRVLIEGGVLLVLGEPRGVIRIW